MSMKRYIIKSFLDEFCSHLEKGNFLLVKRKKNLQTLTQLGYNFLNLQNILSTLTIKNFHSGPEDNDDYDGHIMVFGMRINGNDIYIKLANTDETGISEMAVCISFHIAEYPLSYPLK